MDEKKIKAVALMSGGLDSTLAAKLIKDQGIEVIGLHLVSPFGCRTQVDESAQALGIRLVKRDKGESFLDLLADPKYGYGKNINPCIDCRIAMFQLAEEVRQELGAEFIITGEVIGQRPMSQRRETMHVIDRDSSMAGRLLRPLSAKLFPPTLPEEKGWVDREKLLSIQGRSRKEQFALADQLGVTEFEAPGGGCLLTESCFKSRVDDFLQFEKEHRVGRSDLLRWGRHFRFSEETKVIISRDERENSELERRWEPAEGVFFEPLNFNGPVAVVTGSLGEAEIEFVGQLMVRYCKKSEMVEQRKIGYRSQAKDGEFTALQPMASENIESYRI